MKLLTTHPDQELLRLGTLIEDTDDHLLAFALYRTADEKHQMAEQLEQSLTLPVKRFDLKGETLNPVNILLKLPKQPRQAIFFSFLGSSLPEGKSDFEKFAGYVNIQREAFASVPHAAIFWLREEQLVRLIHLAPDFWAWRSGVFDCRDNLEGTDKYYDLEWANASLSSHLEEQIALYREILASQEQAKNPSLAYIARTHKRLAKSLNKLGLYEDALHAIDELILLADQLRDEKLKASALNDKSLIFDSMGRHDEAEQLSRQALKLTKRLFGEEDPSYAADLSNLASILGHMGRYDEAEPLAQQALEIAKKTFGEADSQYVPHLNNLAHLLGNAGRYDEAEPLARQALEIAKKTFGEEHSDYAVYLQNLATLLKGKGHFHEAEKLYRQALEITKRSQGENNPFYVARLNNLAHLLGRMGRYNEAKQLFQQAVEICEKYLGSHDPNTIKVKQNYQQLLDAFKPR